MTRRPRRNHHTSLESEGGAAAFGWTIGIVWPRLDFDLFRFMSNPPANESGRAGLRNLFRFLNGIAGTASPLSSTQQPMDQVF